LSAIGFEQKDMLISSVSTVPQAQWLLNPDVFKSKYPKISEDLQGFYQIYTGRSAVTCGPTG